MKLCYHAEPVDGCPMCERNRLQEELEQAKAEVAWVRRKWGVAPDVHISDLQAKMHVAHYHDSLFAELCQAHDKWSREARDLRNDLDKANATIAALHVTVEVVSAAEAGQAAHIERLETSAKDMRERAAQYAEECSHDPECLEGCVVADGIRALPLKVERLGPRKDF